MMSDIVKLSQYKSDVQSRKVKKSAIEMTRTHFLWESAKTEQETFTRWQLEETQRLFERLAAKPATTEQLKTYNSWNFYGFPLRSEGSECCGFSPGLGW